MKNKNKDLWDNFFRNRTRENKNALIELYFSFVQKIAYKLAKKINWKVEPDVLASYGVDGLYRAIDKYDVSIGVKFESYASTRINGSMIDGLRRDDIIPRSVRIISDKFEKGKQKIQHKLGHKIPDVEVCESLGIDETYFHKHFRKFSPSIYASLETGLESGQDDFKEDYNYILKDNSDMPGDSVLKNEFFNKLTGNGFSSLERKIIWLYYYKGLTMDKVSKNINLSESRISQMHKSILPRLKDKIKRNPEYFEELKRLIPKGQADKALSGKSE